MSGAGGISGATVAERVDALRAAGTPFVLATVVRAERPTSARPGDRALVLPDGHLEGFVGGTCAEATVRVEGLRLLRDRTSTLLRITPGGEHGPPDEREGMIVVDNPCLSGGTLEIFLEAVVPPTVVHVHGDAPVARALVRLGEAMGWDVRAGGTAGPGAEAVVVASHGRDEEATLEEALRAGVPYVALVASPTRGRAVRDALAVDPTQRERLRTPAGLDLGATTPAEIALSVFAEMVDARRRVAAPTTGPGAHPDVDAEAVDPVCGMTVVRGVGTITAVAAGRTWFFCGSGCRQAFLDDPARHSAPAGRP